jgi:hypothetical protein
MKENFDRQGVFIKKVRTFAPATFREKNVSTVVPMKNNHTRKRLKKHSSSSTLSKRDKKGLGVIG